MGYMCWFVYPKGTKEKHIPYGKCKMGKDCPLLRHDSSMLFTPKLKLWNCYMSVGHSAEVVMRQLSPEIKRLEKEKKEKDKDEEEHRTHVLFRLRLLFHDAEHSPGGYFGTEITKFYAVIPYVDPDDKTFKSKGLIIPPYNMEYFFDMFDSFDFKLRSRREMLRSKCRILSDTDAGRLSSCSVQ